jgi:hypothetical protein
MRNSQTFEPLVKARILLPRAGRLHRGSQARSPEREGRGFCK